RIAGELSARKDESKSPKTQPKQKQVTAIASDAPEKQDNAAGKCDQCGRRQLYSQQYKIKIPGLAAQPINHAMRIKSPHEFVTVVVHQLVAAEFCDRAPRVR